MIGWVVDGVPICGLGVVNNIANFYSNIRM